MIKIFTTNANGKIELTAKELESLLADSYREGYDTAEKAYSAKKSPDVNNRRDFVYLNDPKISKENTTPKLNATSTSTSAPVHKFTCVNRVSDAEKELASLLGISPTELNQVFSELFGNDHSIIAETSDNAFSNLKKEVREV